MSEGNKKSARDSVVKGVRAYAVAGHFVWAVLTPLVVFIGGGSWLINRFNWDYRIIIVFVIIGIVVMVCGVWSYIKQLLSTFDSLKDNTPKVPEFDKRDYDFYYDGRNSRGGNGKNSVKSGKDNENSSSK